MFLTEGRFEAPTPPRNRMLQQRNNTTLGDLLNPDLFNQPETSIPQDETVLTTAVSIRFRKQDAELLREEATRRGFTTTVGFARSLILTGLSRYDESSALLEMILRVESLLF